MTRLPNIIETVTGLGFDYLNPEVKLEDVAHGLAHECRFAGHTTRFYSVAEHSMLVAGIVEQMKPELALAALWHDAHEAYMGDCPTPLKVMLGHEWTDIANRIDEAAATYIGLDGAAGIFRHPFIKYADKAAMLYEAAVLKPGPGWAFTRHMDHTSAIDAAERYSLPLGLLPGEGAEAFKAVDLHLRDLT